MDINSGLLSNQGEKSINFYFIMVPLRKKVFKYGTPKTRILTTTHMKACYGPFGLNPKL